MKNTTLSPMVCFIQTEGWRAPLTPPPLRGRGGGRRRGETSMKARVGSLSREAGEGWGGGLQFD